MFNGTCVDGVTDYTCDCVDGFRGKHCEESMKKSLRGTRNLIHNKWLAAKMDKMMLFNANEVSQPISSN